MFEERNTKNPVLDKSKTGRIVRYVEQEFQKKVLKNPENPVLHISPSAIARELKLSVKDVSHNMRFLDDRSELKAEILKKGHTIHEFKIQYKNPAATMASPLPA